MRIPIPDKIDKLIEDIDANGNTPITRLTVLKKWFERPSRLAVFGFWIARKAAGRKGKTKGDAGVLLDEARVLLGTKRAQGTLVPAIDRAAVERLYGRVRDFHQEFKQQQWGPVRIIHSWPVLLVEKGLALYLGEATSPSDGYKLAADWAQHYDPRFGHGLNGPSRGKLEELLRFMFTVEALEDLQ